MYLKKYIFLVRNEPFKWRDCLKPSDILEEICSKNHLPPPRFINSNTLLVNGVEYRNNEKGLLCHIHVPYITFYM